MKLKKNFLLVSFIYALCGTYAFSQEPEPIFDDKLLLNGYAEKYTDASKEVLMAMIEDDTLSPYKTAAAIRVFREKYSREVFKTDKRIALKTILRCLARSDSSFIQVEIMHTLCLMNRYKYFESMVPNLIQKLNHYNDTVSELSYAALDTIIKNGQNRPREARLIFNTLRKQMFATRKKLRGITEPSPELKRQLELLRWAIKILGNEELRRLPSEVIAHL